VEESVSSKEYKLFLRLLRAEHRRAGLTQIELAKRLRETQTFVSKCGRCERRIDVIKLRAMCKALGTTFAGFVKNLDSTLGS
jgi:transcriptional regulator with XRE-family HTH domain